MTDRLDAITAGLRDGRYDCRVPEDTDDVRWLVGEVRRLRQRHAEAVKSAYIEGRNSDEFDAADKFIEDEYSWLASEAKARLT